MAIEPKVINAGKPVGGGRMVKTPTRRRRTREQRGQAARRVSMRLGHKQALERQQAQASQQVQTARALSAIRSEHSTQETHNRTIVTAKRNVISSAAQNPVGPQVSQGTGTVGGAILRIFIAFILFSVLYLVLVNANQTSGLIQSFGTGLLGLSSDKTIFVKTQTG